MRLGCRCRNASDKDTGRVLVLRKYRRNHGLSRAAVATILDLDLDTYDLLETGAPLQQSLLLRLGLNDPLSRFWSKVDVTGECWVWTGWMKKSSPRFRVNGRADETPVQGTRYAYETLIGPVPVGKVLARRCRMNRCVNPAHMAVVSHKAPSRLRSSFSGAVSSHCVRGHEWVPENMLFQKNGTARCKTCQRESQARSDAKARRREECFAQTFVVDAVWVPNVWEISVRGVGVVTRARNKNLIVPAARQAIADHYEIPGQHQDRIQVRVVHPVLT